MLKHVFTTSVSDVIITFMDQSVGFCNFSDQDNTSSTYYTVHFGEINFILSIHHIMKLCLNVYLIFIGQAVTLSLQGKLNCSLLVKFSLKDENDIMLFKRWTSKISAFRNACVNKICCETQMPLIMANSKDGQGHIFWYQYEDLVSRNAHVHYESSNILFY